MKEALMIKEFKLAGTKTGTISVSHVEAPYGPGSHPIVSVGISLSGNSNDPDWKAHIPYENLDEVIEALQEAKTRYGG